MVPSAGAMLSNQSHTTPRPSSRRANEDFERQEPGTKPKKVNSEIRKQQNRIASRNYREKRKRKLQYLQQLLRDGESPEDAAQAVEEAHQERMVTPEYQVQTQAAPAFPLPSSALFPPTVVTSGNSMDSIFSAATTSYDRQFGRPSQNYTACEGTWNNTMYGHTSNVNMSTWNVPIWMPNVEYTPSVSSGAEDLYTPPQQTHNTFEQLPTPPQQPRTPDPDLFVLGSYGHCRRFDSQQTMGISNVCLPSSAASSPFPYMRYTGPA
ncbi:hypothetical protein DPSP01_009613 [Paraphaeosphaeria sporulosa]|uniref:BZIP domain-containing protein n=1 Tax=Paraphaeosphaeria sporulosa TaxID=1460663 RepID=A0A177CWG4_9PLEO|nr:uncharacterized protein CC84DRAFT_60162 [Paraphaeosphaeria sporulosa]OAG11904.1 hypothetical protein CC84DRAFT_60162 [Paraphaeosphaeria sporulosa]